MNQSVALRIVSLIAFLLAFLVFLMYRDLSKTRELMGPPAHIAWNGLSIDVPVGFALEAWPAFGYPAFTVKKKMKQAEQVRDALYFSNDPAFMVSPASRILTMEQCGRMSKYCVAVHTEQQTATTPFCRASISRGDKGASAYELSVQFEFDDSGNALTYVGSPNGFFDYVSLIDSVIKEYGGRHGMNWTSGNGCAKQVLEAAVDVEPNAAKERPQRKPIVD